MKGKSWLIGISLVLLVSLLGILSYYTFFKKDAKPVAKEPEKVNQITGYGITLNDEDTKLYKNEFNNLKNNLESGNIDYNEYAKSVAKMFIIDLYTINNKKNKYDVGGLEFVFKSAQENYITNVTDTLYKYVTDNTHKTRTQILPEVSDINVDSIENTQFKIEETKSSYNAYKIKLTWNYVEDLGYDKTAEVIVINDSDKLYVVEENIK